MGHGSLMIVFQGKVVHVDPFGMQADYSVLPAADLVLITHEHGDHLDLKAVQAIRKDNTQILYNEKCAGSLSGGIVMHNGDTQLYGPFKIEAVPAYNLVNGPQAGMVYPKKGEGNGYIKTARHAERPERNWDTDQEVEIGQVQLRLEPKLYLWSQAPPDPFT